RAEAYDCKWGARGINGDVLLQLGAARANTEAISPSRYAAAYRVRFDESTPTGTVRTSALLRYAQDVAWIHSDALGFDRDWYAERSLTWLVRAAEVEVLRPIPMGSTLTATTEVVGHRKVWARRRGEFRLADGVLAATVITDWVMVDARGRPARVPGVIEARFPAPPMNEGLMRVELVETPPSAARRAFAVRPQELDPVGHANNGVYLDWLEESVLAADPSAAAALVALPRRYRLDYAGSAGAGAQLESVTWQMGDGWSYRLRTADGAELLRGRLDL
ncbi:MAG TPA: acyl-ACP thioesterase domain-containing protein, partial [Candidatus Limnocylindrales bacterium]